MASVQGSRSHSRLAATSMRQVGLGPREGGVSVRAGRVGEALLQDALAACAPALASLTDGGALLGEPAAGAPNRPVQRLVRAHTAAAPPPRTAALALALAPPPAPLLADTLALSAAQRRAVEHGRTPLLVVAGAGAGKTRVLVHRIAHLVRMGVPPARILALTFTNRAADELRERCRSLLPANAAPLEVGTFHRVACRLLHQHHAAVGLQANFGLCDEAQRSVLLKQCMQSLGSRTRGLRVRQVADRIGLWQDRGWRPEEVPLDGLSARDPTVQAVYALYAARCRGNNVLDFGDQLLMMRQLFDSSPTLSASLQQRWSHVLIDEYQDSNAVQVQILKRLVTPAHSLTACGDDDQAIYSWRGADPGTLLRFAEDFPGGQMLLLHENHRSTPSIVAAANALIGHNCLRVPKTMQAATPAAAGSAGVQRHTFDSGDAEAQAVASRINELLHGGAAPERIAILHRGHAQVQAQRQVLQRLGLPCAEASAEPAPEAPALQLGLSLLRLACNPHADPDFHALLDAAPLALPRNTQPRLLRRALEKGRSSWQLCHDLGQLGQGAWLPAGAAQPLFRCAQQVQRWQAARLAGTAPALLLATQLQDSQLLAQAQTDPADAGQQALATWMALADALPATAAALPTYLSERSQLSRTAPPGNLALGTLHGAKGLEYDWVFLPGLEEGLLPHQRSLEDAPALEEERRLLFVGMTRARRELWLSHAHRRWIYGRACTQVPSRFLREVGETATPRASYSAGRRMGFPGGAEGEP